MKKTFLFFLFLILGTSWGLHASSEKRKEPLLLIEPGFLHPPIADLLPEAKKTVITAAWLIPKQHGTSTTTLWLQPSWKTTSRAFMNQFLQGARETLSNKVRELHPQLLRDEHDVIQVAIIDDPSPITASTILAPNFAQQFISIFGPTFFVALPTTHKIYIFSKLVSPLSAIGAAIRNDYQLSLSPLTLEIFELGQGEIHAVGSLE